MIEAKIVADSINPVGNRITTFVCTYPRFIHAEIMTHRVFSRNAASSRAIPITRVIENIRKSPAMPIHWGKNQKGMQANTEIGDKERAIAIWIESAELAIQQAEKLTELGVHKQVVNRLLEPFAHMTTLITATEYGNFFNLRAHKDAQPEFQELAFQMLDQYTTSIPIEKKAGDWHLPFADRYVAEGVPIDKLLKISTARAARVSYLNFEGDIDHDKDYSLHDQLKSSCHMSPFEHAACALSSGDSVGNFRGWKPYRKLFTDENKQHFDANKLTYERNG